MHHSNELPTSLSNYFTVNSSAHMYGTRTREDMHISSVSTRSTSIGQRSLRYKASKFWNSLPDSLKVIGTSNSKE